MNHAQSLTQLQIRIQQMVKDHQTAHSWSMDRWRQETGESADTIKEMFSGQYQGNIKRVCRVAAALGLEVRFQFV